MPARYLNHRDCDWCGRTYMPQRSEQRFCCVSCANEALVRHGHKREGKYTSEYIAWSNAKSRCHSPRSQAWRNYGGRGIRMCERWRSDFQAFLRDIGPKPSASYELDRIDNDGHYEPGNCRWTTRSINIKNSRSRDRNELGQFSSATSSARS